MADLLIVRDFDVDDIVDAAIGRYIAARRASVPEFVDRHFSLDGALQIHRHAVGLDLVRAPLNIVASIATAGKKIAAASMRRAGAEAAADRFDRRNLFLGTDVGRQIEWHIYTDLLKLPFEQSKKVWIRSSERDALSEEILKDPRVEARVAEMLAALGKRADDVAFRKRLTEAMGEYVGSRAAASDITNALFATATGLAAYHQFTPGAAALSGAVAASLTKSAAISSFWAGPWLGGLYYGAIGVSTPPALFATVFAGVLIPMAALTAFAGVVSDPVQRRLGVHQKRLNRLIDTVEDNLRGNGNAKLAVRDHYVARVLDMMDWTSTIMRLAGH